MTKPSNDTSFGRGAEEARSAEARAILNRIRQETEPQVGAGPASMMTSARDHFAARDADPADRIEVLGTRIGRILGLGAVFVLAILVGHQLLAD